MAFTTSETTLRIDGRGRIDCDTYHIAGDQPRIALTTAREGQGPDHHAHIVNLRLDIATASDLLDALASVLKRDGVREYLPERSTLLNALRLAERRTSSEEEDDDLAPFCEYHGTREVYYDHDWNRHGCGECDTNMEGMT